MSVGRNLKNVIIGTGISQVITFLSLPIITKIYMPEEIGYYAVCLAIVSIIGMVSSMRLERTLFCLNEKRDFDKRISGIISISFLNSFIFTFIVWVLKKIEYLDISDFFLPIIFFWGWCASLYQVFLVVISVKGDFKLISFLSIIKSACLVLLQVSFFFIFDQIFALLLSGLFSFVLGLIIIIKKNYFCFFLINPVFYILKYKRDCINGLFQSFFSSVNNNVSIILISQMWGVKEAGIFLLVEKLMRIPISLISNNLRPVAAKYYQDNKKRNIYSILKMSFYMMILSIVIVTFVIINVEWIIKLVLNDEWYGITTYIKIMAFLIIPNFTSIPFQSYNLHYNDTKNVTIIEFLSLMCKLFSIYIFYVFNYDLKGACVAIVLTYYLNLFLNVIFATYSIKKEK